MMVWICSYRVLGLQTRVAFQGPSCCPAVSLLTEMIVAGTVMVDNIVDLVSLELFLDHQLV